MSLFVILNSFTPCSYALVASFEKIMVCWEGSYYKHNFSKRDLTFYVIFQVLKFVLWYDEKKMEQEWAAYSFNYPLVIDNNCKLMKCNVTLVKVDEMYNHVRTNRWWLKKSLVILFCFLKMIKLLVILFIIKLYARNNTFKNPWSLPANFYLSRDEDGIGWSKFCWSLSLNAHTFTTRLID